MIDLGLAAVLAMIAAGTGKRILDWLGQSPERPFDALALAVPLGLGTISLAALALGEAGYLNRVGLAILLAVLLELGVVGWFRLWRDWRAARAPRHATDRSCTSSPFLWAGGAALLAAMLMAALAPVTDGDALCYHLQVPKVFLIRGAVDFLPDLHETVYPLVTEMLYALALEFRGPVACRAIQWVLGLVFAANVTALARPSLGRRAGWAGAIALLSPAVTNGMSAPLNDVSLAAFGTAAIFAWTRLLDRPSYSAALAAGALVGIALGVKYQALVLFALLSGGLAVAALRRHPATSKEARPPWLALAAVYIATAALVGNWWYLRAFIHTGNPVFPFFRTIFGAGLDQVLDPIKRPLPVTPINMLSALVPLSLQPDRFDSFSHQFGPVFLLFLPALFLERVPRRVVMLAALGYAFLMICMTQRQSMRFLLIALGPMSVAVAYLASIWCDRKTVPARLLLGLLLAVLGFEAAIAVSRARHALPVLLGRETTAEFLARCEPTFQIGRWAARNLPPWARLIGQDHRGFYIPRDYTMELAHRRRTGLGGHGESAGDIVASLRESGFTHVMFCPPVPENAVEFDATLGRLLAPWLRDRTPLFRRDLTDGDGVVRRYAIYALGGDSGVAAGPVTDRVSARPGEVIAR